MDNLKVWINILKRDAARYEANSFLSILKLLFSNGGFSAVFLCRIQSAFTNLGLIMLAKIVSRLNLTINGFDATIGSEIGSGFIITHPVGIVLGNQFRAGENLVLMPNVVIGQRGFTASSNNLGNPRLGNNIRIGAGSIILGNISLGDNSIVAAGTLLTRDLAADCYAFGNPAQIKKIADKTDFD